MPMSDSSAVINVVVVDDNIAFRSSLVDALQRQSREIRILAEGGSAEEAIRLAKQMTPDVLLLDLSLPPRRGLLTRKSPKHGFEALRTIRRATPKTRILIVSNYDTDPHDLGLLCAVQCEHICGYIAKRDELEDMLLVQATLCIGRGKTFYSPLVEPIFQRLQGLTERERHVFVLLVRGETNYAISKELDIAESTVKTHVRSILPKLALQSREEMSAGDNCIEIFDKYDLLHKCGNFG
jgi:DNA-binding NarL/FixJ family response regulator